MILLNGDWGLGIGDWGLGPIPNPQSPNPQSPIPNALTEIKSIYIKNNKINFYKNINNKIIKKNVTSLE